jgi:hypothetical protein
MSTTGGLQGEWFFGYVSEFKWFTLTAKTLLRGSEFSVDVAQYPPEGLRLQLVVAVDTLHGSYSLMRGGIVGEVEGVVLEGRIELLPRGFASSVQWVLTRGGGHGGPMNGSVS